MTAKQLFEGFLMELKKEESPHFHLREFNYYVNEVINEFCNNIYLTFERNQGSLDYLRNIKKYIELNSFNPTQISSWKTPLPTDYRHLANCIVYLKVVKPIQDKCYPPSDVLIDFEVKRLPSDQRQSIIKDYFQRPRYFRPYWHIVDNNIEIFLDTNVGLPGSGAPIELHKITMDYLKAPEEITLTYDQAYDDFVDSSQVLEFDEIAAKEIRKLLIQRVMERDMNQRLQSHIPITQTKPDQSLVQETR